MASKNKYIAFHGGNEAAVQVYRDLKRIAHERDLFIWQVIQAGLDALEEREAVEEAMQACMDALPNYIESLQPEQNETEQTCPDCGIKSYGYCRECVEWTQDKLTMQNETK